MNTVLMKEYPLTEVDKYYFVKRVYFDYASERVYFDLLVYSQKYQGDIEYLLECVEAASFDKVVDKAIKDFLKQKGVNYEKY